MQQHYTVCHCCGGYQHPPTARPLSKDGTLPPEWETLLDAIFDGALGNGDIDRATTLTTAQNFMQAVAEGYGRSFADVAYNTPDYRALAALEKNVYQFSGAKNYQTLKELSLLVKDGDRFRTFEEFRREAVRLLDEWNDTHQRTEYTYAVAASQMAGKWAEFKAAADVGEEVFLQYTTVGDQRVREEHALMDGITLPMNDQFWEQYYPPNGYNCRCSVIRKVGDVKPTPKKDIVTADIPKLFRVNHGERQLAFPPDHPYYIGYPKHILKEAESIRFKTNQDEVISRLVGVVEIERKELPKPITFSKKGIKEAFNQPHDQYSAKNTMLLKIDEVLSEATYKGFNQGTPDNPGIIGSHIFEIYIEERKSYLIVRQHADGGMRFYSISDSKKVLKGIKKPG